MSESITPTEFDQPREADGRFRSSDEGKLPSREEFLSSLWASLKSRKASSRDLTLRYALFAEISGWRAPNGAQGKFSIPDLSEFRDD